MTWFGIDFDVETNNKIHGKEAEITLPDSKIRAFVIPTDEELMIARDVEHFKKLGK